MSIKLTKKGFVRSEWNKEDKEYDTFLVQGLDVISQWMYGVEIEKGVTLGDLVKIFEEDDELLSFVEVLTDCNIRAYMASLYEPLVAKEEESKDEKCSPLTSIEVYAYVEVDNYHKEDKFPQLNYNIGCHGRSTIPYRDTKSFGEDAKDNFTWAIEFTPWNKLRDLPLVLEETGKLIELKWISKGKPRVFLKQFPEMTSNRKLQKSKQTEVLISWTLGQFFHALFNELCFCGSPIGAKDMIDELNERVKDIEKEYKDKDVLEKKIDIKKLD